MKKEVNKINNKKIIFEIILIPCCFLYLLNTILHNHPKISFIICSCLIIITSLEFTIKYFKEVYIYEHKYNYLKIIFGIFNILFIGVTGLNLIYNLKILNILFIIFTIILLLFLLGFVIKKLVNIWNNKGFLYKNSFGAFLALIAFVTILITLIIML